MSLIGSSILAGSAANQGYTIEKSLQFNGTDEYLSRTLSTGGSRTKWTWSGWVKLGQIENDQTLIAAGDYAQSQTRDTEWVSITSGAQLFWGYAKRVSGSYIHQSYVYSTALFRDPSSWYHIVVVKDVSNPVTNDRVIFYVNGVRMPAYATNAVENTNGRINDSTASHKIGLIDAAYAGGWSDKYLADVHFIDGQALDPTYFGETSNNYGQWIPKKYAGTYGTNGFFLDFEDNYYEDKSGNGNDWTANNLASTDVVDDTPNINFCTLNPLRNKALTSISCTDGNLTFSANDGHTLGTIILPLSGKYYFEMTCGSVGGQVTFGLGDIDYNQSAGGLGGVGMRAYSTNARLYGPTNTNTGITYTTNDVIGVAVNMDTGVVTFYKNNTSIGTFTDLISSGQRFAPFISATNGTGGGTVNFGQKSFAYTPPTGFNTLCTDNLPEPTVTPGEHFNTVLYSGNDGATATKSVTGVGFQPDVVWIKNRTATSNHNLFTSTLGPEANTALLPNATNTPLNRGFKTYDSDGFTLTNLGHNDNNEESYASWHWKAGGSSTTVNTDGTTSSNTSVNTSAGFSIVSFNAGAAGNHTVGHGLGVTPELIIMKDLDSSGYGNWLVFHSDVCTSTSNYLLLNGTGALGSVANSWGSALPTSTVFGFGSNVNVAANDDIVAYCFASVEGYSKFGSYTGNGSTDGPFIYTGFRPAWIMIKRTDATNNWVMHDTKRDPYNQALNLLWPNLSNAEAAGSASNYGFDLLSNGFKAKGTTGGGNDSGGTYIYAAFAENPFKYANARGTSFDKFTTPSASALTIPQSARFDGSSAHLERSVSVAGNRKTWTWSGWFKKSENGTTHDLFSAKKNGLTYPNMDIAMEAGDYIRIWDYQGSAGSPSNTFLVNKYTTRLFRDTSSWYHIVVAVDTTDATAEDRVKLFVNGSRITDFSTNTNPTQDRDLEINNATNHILGGNAAGSSGYVNGYLAEVNFIDGQALGPESFGYQDTTTKQWLPRSYNDFGPEIDYGANGFRLDFQSGALGTDRSGSNNDWTLTNMSSTNDVVLDSPNNNFATLNPLSKSNYSTTTPAEGSLQFDGGNISPNNYEGAAMSAFGVSSGKWYWEVYVYGSRPNTISASDWNIGITPNSNLFGEDYAYGPYIGYGAGYGYTGYGVGTSYIRHNNANSGSYGSTFSSGDIIGVALDMDAGTLVFYRNGSSEGTAVSSLSGTYYPIIALQGGSWSTSSGIVINFGQDSSFAGNVTRQSNQDGNSIGDFYYTPPSGYLALCTDNLPSPTIANGRDYFNTVLYTGNGTTGNGITGVGFQPDFVWAKGRSVGYSHGLYDAVRGDGNKLSSNLTNAETSGGITSIDADGFTLDSDAGLNESSATYASWNWKAGDSTVVNTTGTLSANVCASTTSGVSIATFTVPSSGQFTVGHGLGSTPAFVVVKNRSGTGNWFTYHQSLGANNTDYLALNTTAAEATYSTMWGASGMTSTTVGLTVGGSTYASADHVLYAFSPVAGYSAFGSYTGNGSTDGPFIHTGFRPAFVMMKRTDSTSDWWMQDSARNTYNVVNNQLYANSNSTEQSDSWSDFLSNGFKIRNTYSNNNGSGGTYIYAAFAENPFKNASAR